MPLFWIDISALSLSALIAFALTLLVFGVEPGNPLNRWFALFTLSEAVWAICSILWRLALWLDRGNPLLLVELGTFALAIMGPLLLFFTSRYVGWDTAWINRGTITGLALIGGLGVPLFRHQIVANPTLHPNGSVTVDLTGWGLLVALVPLVYMFWALVLFRQARGKIEEPFLRLSLLVLLAGFVVGGILEIEFPVLSITNTVSVTILGYGVVRRQLFNPLKTRTIELQREIAERERVAAALRESEMLYRMLVETAPDGLVMTSLDARLTYASQHALDMFGVAHANDLLGQNVLNFFAPEDRERVLDNVQKLFEKGMMSGIEYSLMRRDGTRFQAEIDTSLVRDNDGTPQALMNVIKDITVRKQAEADLRQRQRELESLLANSRDLSSTLDLDALLALIAERATSLLHGSEFIIFRLEEDGRVLCPILAFSPYIDEIMAITLPVGRGLTGYAVQHREPLLVNDAENDPRSLVAPKSDSNQKAHVMVAPLIVRERVIGAMVINREPGTPFTPADLRLFVGFARHAAIALDNAQIYSQLETFNESLQRAVDERTAELQEANRAKDEFVSMVSHELKTPLTSLKLRLHLLEQGPEDIQRHMDVMRREVNRQARTIEDLLFLSRLDQDRVRVVLAPARLNPLVREYVEDREPLAQEKGLNLWAALAPELPPVYADAGLIGQVVSILLTNALDYTPAGGEVAVSTQTGGEMAGFSVTDTGPGIPPDEQPRLFERFFRGTAGLESSTRGTGLGLAIAKEIIDRHQGRIEVFSEGIPGRGTTFRVWLPVVGAE